MSGKIISVTKFKADYLNLINQMNIDGEPVVITRRGHAVAMLSPVRRQAGKSGVIGALKGTVKNFADPCMPVSGSDRWTAVR